MRTLGIFVDHKTLGREDTQYETLKIRDAAEKLGYECKFVFPVDLPIIKNLDGLFIRAITDPRKNTYAAAQIAQIYGIPVIDSPDSIKICADKINMYEHLIKNEIPLPKTRFLEIKRADVLTIDMLFEELKNPLILKEPSSCFSKGVEKVHSRESFLNIINKYRKTTDWIVVQEFITSEFDWRIGVLNGKLLYAAKYYFVDNSFKIQEKIGEKYRYGRVVSVKKEDIPKVVLKTALDAANSIGNGLYGVDLKQSSETVVSKPLSLIGRSTSLSKNMNYNDSIKASKQNVVVIEVNDNPSLDGGEDTNYPKIYEKIVTYIMEELKPKIPGDEKLFLIT